MTEFGHHRSPRSRATRDGLLRAAGLVLSERGYEGTSLEQIASAAGLTKGTLYYHFSSKEEIYAAVLTAYIREAIERAESAMSSTNEPQQALDHIIDLVLEDTLEPTKRYIHYQEIVRVGDELGTAVRNVQRQYEGLVADAIAAAQNSGHVRSGDP